MTAPAFPSVAARGNVNDAVVEGFPLTGSGTAQFVIQVPPSASSTQSITIQANSAMPVVQNVSSTAPGCITGTVLTCTVNVSAPPGAVIFTIKTYSAPDGTGTLLESGTLRQTITSGATTTLNVILGGGTVVKLALSLKTASPRECNPAVNIPLYASGKDAAGNVIIGPYSNAMTLTDSDTSGATALSTTSLTASNTAVTLSYNGHLLPSAKIGATGAGIISSNVTPATLAPQQMLYVRSASGIAVFPLTANGTNVVPTRSFNDAGGVIANSSNSGTALSKNCVLYVYSYTVDSSNNAHYGIFGYPAGASGTVTAVATITGSNTDLLGSSAQGGGNAQLSFDASGRIYVATMGFDTATQRSWPTIFTFPAGANGNVAPSAKIFGTTTQLQTPAGVALSKTGDIYVSDQTGTLGPTIYVFAAGSSGNVAPIRSIAGTATDFAGGDIGPIALDSTGRLYVADYAGSNDAYAVAFAPGASGNAAPIELITSATSAYAYAGGIGLDYKDNVFISDPYAGTTGNGGVNSYAAHQTGTVSATRTALGSTVFTHTFQLAL